MTKKTQQQGLKVLRWTLPIGCFGCLCLGFLGFFPALPRAQVAPALLMTLTILSVGTLTLLLGLLLITFLFGRFYCSLLCPLGILQDLIGIFSWQKDKITKHTHMLRYLIAGSVFGLLISGWATGLRFLDPYSTFGRIFTCASLVGIGSLILLIGLTLWQKRFFCNTICPVGTLLGGLAKRGLFRLALSEKCVTCGACVKQCPSGCIDLTQKQVDNERCVRCMNCMTTCPTGAITLTTSAPPPTQNDRRTFLVNSAMLLAGVGSGMAWTTLQQEGTKDVSAFPILPPGAGDKKRFWSKCTACQRCVTACPEGIIVPTQGGLGPVILDLNRGACRFNCHQCADACPTGALLPLTLAEKQRTKIGEAKFNAKLCKVFQDDESCGDCAKICPKHAIRLRKTGAPYPVKANHCIGCGLCQKACPSVHGKAIVVYPIEQQECLTPHKNNPKALQ